MFQVKVIPVVSIKYQDDQNAINYALPVSDHYLFKQLALTSLSYC